MLYRAYLRCSTDSQDFARQQLQLEQWLREQKINRKDVKVYTEKRSGRTAQRDVYKQVMEELQEGECLLLVELSRCHRNMQNVRKMWQDLIDKGSYIAVCNYKLLDTRPKGEDNLTARLVQNIMLDVLSFTCKMEANLITERMQNGRKASSKKQGRRELSFETLPKEFIEVYKKNSNLRKKDLLVLINNALKEHNKKEISRQTMYSWLEVYNKSMHEAEKCTLIL